MAFEPIWRATVQSRKKPSKRLASTLAITMPVDWAMRRLTEGVAIGDIMPDLTWSVRFSCTAGGARTHVEPGGAPAQASCSLGFPEGGRKPVVAFPAAHHRWAARLVF